MEGDAAPFARSESKPNERANAVQPLVNTKAAATWLGMSKSWLDHRRAKGEGPRVTRIGRKAMYRVEDLAAYAEDNLEPV